MSIILFYKLSLISFVNLHSEKGIQLYDEKLNKILLKLLERNVSQFGFFGGKFDRTMKTTEAMSSLLKLILSQNLRREWNSSFDLYLKAVNMVLNYFAKMINID